MESSAKESDIQTDKVDSITKLLEKCFALKSFDDDGTKSSEDNETEKTLETFENNRTDIEDIEDTKSENTDTESECKMWQYATNEIENYESQKGMNYNPIL